MVFVVICDTFTSFCVENAPGMLSTVAAITVDSLVSPEIICLSKLFKSSESVAISVANTL